MVQASVKVMISTTWGIASWSCQVASGSLSGSAPDFGHLRRRQKVTFFPARLGRTQCGLRNHYNHLTSAPLGSVTGPSPPLLHPCSICSDSGPDPIRGLNEMGFAEEAIRIVAEDDMLLGAPLGHLSAVATRYLRASEVATVYKPHFLRRLAPVSW